MLLDGSWRQARCLLRANPQLQSLQRWALPAQSPSRYLIRKAHRPLPRSTLEAACLALGTLEGRPAFCAPLLAGFDDPRNRSWTRPSGPLRARLGRRDNAAGYCLQGFAAPPDVVAAAQSGA